MRAGYKSLCIAVMICASLVNTQTHIQDSFRPINLLAQPAELKRLDRNRFGKQVISSSRKLSSTSVSG